MTKQELDYIKSCTKHQYRMIQEAIDILVSSYDSLDPNMIAATARLVSTQSNMKFELQTLTNEVTDNDTAN